MKSRTFNKSIKRIILFREKSYHVSKIVVVKIVRIKVEAVVTETKLLREH